MAPLLEEAKKAVPALVKMADEPLWVDYDREADVLYISFERPQKASEGELLENDVIVRRRGKKLIGLTILNASRFGGPGRTA